MGRISFMAQRVMSLLAFAVLLLSAQALIAQQVHIRIAGGVPPDRQLLSAFPGGDRIELYNRDDGSGRQVWFLEPVRGSRFVHIRVADGTPYDRRVLSTTPDGAGLDLYHDDGSGRQLWEIERIPGSRFVRIRIAGGTPRDRQYLSVFPGGDRLELYHDDGSGRQQWLLEEFGRRGDDHGRRPLPPDSGRHW